MQQNYYKDSSLSKEIRKAVEKMGYETMTPIQAQTIPLLLEGHDLIGQSSTGSGKTAAFGIPAIEVLEDEPTNRPKIVILSPTRELAMQISDELKKFAYFKENISLATVYGGQSMDTQIRQLKKAHIVIGTPGRMMDHMRRRTLKLDDVSMVILDEADEMLNMGFIDDIKFILSEAPEERQTVLFSATMPKEIRNIADEFLKNPKHVTIQSEQRTVENVSQEYFYINQRDKNNALKLLLSYHQPKRSLVFCNTKRMVDDLVEILSDAGHQTIGLHGDMRQATRTKVMNDYKSGKISILIATDVAARGIDVTDIDAVFNYDIPQELEYYIHRIGRTARAGKKGSAYTLISNQSQLRNLRDIERKTNAQISEQDLPNSDTIYHQNKQNLANRIQATINANSDKYSVFIDELFEQGLAYRDIAIALTKMLAKHDSNVLPNVKDISSIQSAKNKKSDDFNRLKVGKGQIAALKIGIGRDQSIKPNHIVGALVQETGLSSKSIGKISIHKTHTLVEMHEDDARTVLGMLSSLKINKKNVDLSFDDGTKSGSSHSRSKTSSNKNTKYAKKKYGNERENKHSKNKKYDSRKRNDHA